MAAERTPAEFKAPARFRFKQLVRKVARYARMQRVVQREKLVVVDDSERCPNPIFLTGVHRSGTTLMRRIIDSHSRIACPPETFFLTGFSRLMETERFQKGFEAMGFDRSAFAQGLHRGVSYFFELYRQSKGKPRWADKTPEYVRILPFIEEVFGPSCQYLMIYRHPFDVMNSLMSSGWDFTSEQWECLTYHDDLFTNMLMYHADVLQQQIDFAAAHDERCHSIRYEDLVADPEPRLREVFEFLGEPWEADVLAFHEKPHDKGTGDPIAASTKGFRPSVNNWKGWTNEQISLGREILERQLEQLGYGTDG